MISIKDALYELTVKLSKPPKSITLREYDFNKLNYELAQIQTIGHPGSGTIDPNRIWVHDIEVIKEKEK